MIHALTSSKNKYSLSMISHMIATILKEYPIEKYGSSPITYKQHKPKLSVQPPPIVQSSTRKVKKGASFFSKLFT